MAKSSVYIILRPNVMVPENIKEIIRAHNALFDADSRGAFIHFEYLVWNTSYDDAALVESFLATLPRTHFLFIRVSSLDDVDVAGDYYNHPYKSIMPLNLVEFLEGF